MSPFGKSVRQKTTEAVRKRKISAAKFITMTIGRLIFGFGVEELAPDVANKMIYYAIIAFISGFTPKIRIILFKLYANTCKLISVPTRGRVLVRK